MHIDSWDHNEGSDAMKKSQERYFAADGELVDGKGFEPSTPTLRTWCSPS